MLVPNSSTDRTVLELLYSSIGLQLISWQPYFDNGRETDWLQAFAAHPAIGDKQALRDKFAPSRSGWEAEEQAASAGATEVCILYQQIIQPSVVQNTFTLSMH